MQRLNNRTSYGSVLAEHVIFQCFRFTVAGFISAGVAVISQGGLLSSFVSEFVKSSCLNTDSQETYRRRRTDSFVYVL